MIIFQTPNSSFQTILLFLYVFVDHDLHVGGAHHQEGEVTPEAAAEADQEVEEVTGADPGGRLYFSYYITNNSIMTKLIWLILFQ